MSEHSYVNLAIKRLRQEAQQKEDEAARFKTIADVLKSAAYDLEHAVEMDAAERKRAVEKSVTSDNAKRTA